METAANEHEQELPAYDDIEEEEEPVRLEQMEEAEEAGSEGVVSMNRWKKKKENQRKSRWASRSGDANYRKRSTRTRHRAGAAGWPRR